MGQYVLMQLYLHEASQLLSVNGSVIMKRGPHKLLDDKWLCAYLIAYISH